VVLLACSLCGCTLLAHGQNADGVRLVRQGFHQAAIERFQQAIASDPQNPDGYYNLAAAYHRLARISGNPEHWEQAESYYNQCKDRDPNHQDCYRGLAVLLVQRGRKDEAFRLLETWSERYPTSPTPKIELARLYEEMADRETAREYLYDALSVDPYNARALAALGRLHEQDGNMAQALADYQRSLAHDRFQPELAARVAALTAALSRNTATAPQRTGRAPSGPRR
jgi:tetratricopeptide (TPR) repeat protein